MSTVTTTSTEIIKVEEITSIMTGAGEVLAKNQNLSQKAADKGRSLIDTAEAEGMSAELDAEMNKWQVSAKQALELMNTRRSPVTQMANQIVRAFTSLEAPIDPKKAGSTYELIQLKRNAFAKSENDRIRKEQEAIMKKQQADKERIEIRSKIEESLRMTFQDYLLKAKTYLNDMFEKITLENFDKGSQWLKDFSVAFKVDKWNEFRPNVTAVHISAEELENITLNVKTGLFEGFAATYRENIEATKEQLIDKLPSKKQELEEMAKADESKRKELEEEAERRKQAEQKRLQDEADEQKRLEQERINTQKQVETANTLFNTSAELSSIEGPSGKTRQGYKINILNAAGYGAIFLFWFENEGAKMDPAAMGKKTIDQMKSFCEKHAHKTGTKIESQHLVYEEDFKAVASKAA